MECRSISALPFLPSPEVMFLEMFRALVSSDQSTSKVRTAKTASEIALVPIEKPVFSTSGTVEKEFNARTRSATLSPEAQTRKLKDSAALRGGLKYTADSDQGHQPINSNRDPRKVNAWSCSVDHCVSRPCAKRRKLLHKLNHLGRTIRKLLKKLTSKKCVDGKKRTSNMINVTTEISVTSEPRPSVSRSSTIANDYDSPLTTGSTTQTAKSTLNSTKLQPQTSKATGTGTKKDVLSPLSPPEKISTSKRFSFAFPATFNLHHFPTPEDQKPA